MNNIIRFPVELTSAHVTKWSKKFRDGLDEGTITQVQFDLAMDRLHTNALNKVN